MKFCNICHMADRDVDVWQVGGAKGLVVLPLDMAIKVLPVLSTDPSLDRDEESDIVEGYDRGAFDKDVMFEEEVTRKKYGWV